MAAKNRSNEEKRKKMKAKYTYGIQHMNKVASHRRKRSLAVLLVHSSRRLYTFCVCTGSFYRPVLSLQTFLPPCCQSQRNSAEKGGVDWVVEEEGECSRRENCTAFPPAADVSQRIHQGNRKLKYK